MERPVVLKTGDTLHTIGSRDLALWSKLLPGVFELDEPEEGSEKLPIDIPGCTSDDFESVVTLLSTPCVLEPNLTRMQWLSVLRLGTMWGVEELRGKAIKSISGGEEIAPVDLVCLGIQYKVSSWIIDGCRTITQGNDSTTIDELAKTMGWEVAAKIAQIRRVTSELSKYNPILVPQTSVRCISCSGSMSYTIHPRPTNAPNHKDYPGSMIPPPPPPVILGEQCVVSPVAWRPRQGMKGQWHCGKCDIYGYAPIDKLPLEFVLADLIPDFTVENTEVIKRILWKELGEAQ